MGVATGACLAARHGLLPRAHPARPALGPLPADSAGPRRQDARLHLRGTTPTPNPNPDPNPNQVLVDKTLAYISEGLPQDKRAEPWRSLHLIEGYDAGGALRGLVDALNLARCGTPLREVLSIVGPNPNPSPNPNQARRVGALQTYLRQQEEAFASILLPPPPRSARAAVLQVFVVPGYEWQSLTLTLTLTLVLTLTRWCLCRVTSGARCLTAPRCHPGCRCDGTATDGTLRSTTNPDPDPDPDPDPGSDPASPPTLQVELPLDGQPQRARIPRSWQLCVWVDADFGFWRHDVQRDTTVGAH